MMPYESYVNLITQLDDLVAIFERHPDPIVREQVGALLSGLDALHREGLTRLVQALRDAGAANVVEEAAEDPVVKTLLGLYDLAELDVPGEPQQPPGQTAFIPLERVAAPRKPRATWVEIARVEDVPPGSTLPVVVDKIKVLLANVDGEIYAYRGICPGTEFPLDTARLEGNELVCSWHGCRFDARAGTRRDQGQGRLEVFPVAVRESSIQLARQSAPASGGTNGTTPGLYPTPTRRSPGV